MEQLFQMKGFGGVLVIVAIVGVALIALVMWSTRQARCSQLSEQYAAALGSSDLGQRSIDDLRLTYALDGEPPSLPSLPSTSPSPR